jgi:hypothetical protein
VLAHQILQGQELPIRRAVWYVKACRAFSDTLAFVRKQLWPVEVYWMLPSKREAETIPKALLERLIDTLAFAT